MNLTATSPGSTIRQVEQFTKNQDKSSVLLLDAVIHPVLIVRLPHDYAKSEGPSGAPESSGFT